MLACELVIWYYLEWIHLSSFSKDLNSVEEVISGPLIWICLCPLQGSVSMANVIVMVGATDNVKCKKVGEYALILALEVVFYQFPHGTHVAWQCTHTCSNMVMCFSQFWVSPCLVSSVSLSITCSWEEKVAGDTWDGHKSWSSGTEVKKTILFNVVHTTGWIVVSFSANDSSPCTYHLLLDVFGYSTTICLNYHL